MPSCFDTAPEFIDEDHRRFRAHSPISKEHMESKHEALFPASILKGKTVLDFGSCVGTTGHWCLSHGATHYTGVELQQDYVDLSTRLLGKYHAADKFAIHKQSIEGWLKENGGKQTYDVVSILGVIYVFTDYYSVLKGIAELARNHVVVEGLFQDNRRAGQGPDFCGVQFINNQNINVAHENASMVGRGTRISPKGMMWLMAEFGFHSPEGQIHPRPIKDVPDVYNGEFEALAVLRYLMRFQRGQGAAQSLTRQLQDGSGKREPWLPS